MKPLSSSNTLHNSAQGKQLLNQLLQGKLPQGIILLYGRGGADKTNFSINSAVYYGSKGKTVLYFDADGSFSRVRLNQTVKKYAEASKRILIARPKTFAEQTKIITHLEEYVTPQVGLIIFESINFLYRISLDGYMAKAHTLNRILNFQLAILSQISRKHNIPILLTSQVRYSLKTGKVEPVAAKILRYWADTIVFLDPDEQHQKTTAILEKPATARKTFPWLKYALWGTRKPRNS